MSFVENTKLLGNLALALNCFVVAACMGDGNSTTTNTSRTATFEQQAFPRLEQTVVLSGPVGIPGETLYLPFNLPAGIQRLEARFVDGSPDTKLGLGLFGPGGAKFQLSDFRGITGEERREIFVQRDAATLGFTAGDLPSGEWQIAVPNFLNFGGTAFVEVKMFSQNGIVDADIVNLTKPVIEPVPEMVIDQPGWYKGDLHVHTVYSSDAFSSGSAKTPREAAEAAKANGLDFIALTDHNVTVQNRKLRSASPDEFLLLAGEEVTTWQGGPGHLVVVGLDENDHIDWRFRPEFGKYARTPLWNENDSPIIPLLETLREKKIFATAAHPYVVPGAGSDWGFFQDSDLDARALPDALEIWNAEFFASSGDLSLRQWDLELSRNRKLCVNGGSDIHGFDGSNPLGTPYKIGTPTTVVWAESLSRRAIIDSLRSCRAYITKDPEGPMLVIKSAEVMMGDTVVASLTDLVPIEIEVAQAMAGAILLVFHNGAPVHASILNGDSQSVTVNVPALAQGGVRAELRPPLVPPSYPTPLALTNPIFIRLANN
ncbi:CehA/McbA family metallohydrolase [Limnobacter parvus]|uniref:CehA/McbA family metallohydrolase n=1 Tax=Limnobacter parvus TaxID=2939690 RepID=A0ABT1XEJ2_9BURK|nr:CehA/McbA family metallohydrolase [Limnobacter parvus]